MSKNETGQDDLDTQYLYSGKVNVGNDLNISGTIKTDQLNARDLVVNNNLTVNHNVVTVGADCATLNFPGGEMTYTKGTWTPVFLQFYFTPAVIHYYVQTGTWFKFGNLVTVMFDVGATIDFPYGGGALIQVNLPFQPKYPNDIGPTCATSVSDITGHPYPYYITCELDTLTGLSYALYFNGFHAGIWGGIKYVDGVGINRVACTLTYEVA